MENLPNTIADRSFLDYSEIKAIDESINEITHNFKISRIPFVNNPHEKWVRRWEYCKMIYYAKNILKINGFNKLNIIDVGGAGTIFPFCLSYSSYRSNIYATEINEKKCNLVHKMNNIFTLGQVKPVIDDILATRLYFNKLC